MRWFLILLALASSAFGQIIVPKENEEYKLIHVAFSSDIPDGATIRGDGWVIPEDVSYSKVDSGLICTAPPGTYELRFDARWIHLEEFTFTDGNDKEITITQYLGDGDIDETATFTVLGDPDPVVVDPVVEPSKPDRATYIYEKDHNAVPREVGAALQELNSQGIDATDFERDTTDGTGETPAQYRAALEAARENGFPCLVVESAGEVVKVVSDPRTKAQVMGAIQ
jgi:hypothetical protein